MLTPGQIVDRYRIEALIGEGGMAQVYRARHVMLGHRCAIKVLTSTHSGLRERLLQEGHIQAQLNHPAVVPVTDVIDVGGFPALVMKLVEGPTLEVWIRKHHPLPYSEVDRVFRIVVAGVAAAHEAGVFHRDLKPGNVLMTAEVDRWSPCVTDFGIAKVFQEQGQPGQTRSNVGMGTPAYMAPEQFWDARSVDARADVYSLGCILYEMVTARVGFGEPGGPPGPREEMPIPDPSLHRADVPVGVRRAILGALAPRRDDRIASCAALLSVLGGGEWDRPTRVGPPRVAPAVPTPESPEAPRLSLPSPSPSPAPADQTYPLTEPPREAHPLQGRAGWLLGLGVLALVGLVGLFVARDGPQAVREGGPAEASPAEARPTGAQPAEAPPAEALSAAVPAVVPPEIALAERTEEDSLVSPPPAGERGLKAAKSTSVPPTATVAEPAAPAPVAPKEGTPKEGTPKEGTLKVSSFPWSVVVVDGHEAGRTFFNGPLTPGSHRVELRTEAGAVYRTEVYVTEGGATLLCWDFNINGSC